MAKFPASLPSAPGMPKKGGGKPNPFAKGKPAPKKSGGKRGC